jgi:hypothetical protein
MKKFINCTLYKILLGIRLLSWLKCFVFFFQFLQADTGIQSTLGHDPFLHNTFPRSIHQSASHSTSYTETNSVLKRDTTGFLGITKQDGTWIRYIHRSCKKHAQDLIGRYHLENWGVNAMVILEFILSECGVNRWAHLSQGRVQWRDLVNTEALTAVSIKNMVF